MHFVPLNVEIRLKLVNLSGRLVSVSFLFVEFFRSMPISKQYNRFKVEVLC